MNIRLPRPATVIASLALVVAMGGTAAYAANTVRSGDIVDGQVFSRDIQNRTIKGLDIAEGTIGSRAIADNAVRANDLGAVFTVSGASSAVTDADGNNNGGAVQHVTATAQCPPGSILLSGGARWVTPSIPGSQNGNVYVQEQYRSGAGNDWTVEGIVDFGASGNIKLQAQAYCLQGQAPLS